MGDRQLDQIDLPPLDRGQAVRALEQDAVVAVGIVADDDRAGVLAAGRGDGQGVHVGHGHAVELAGGVLVPRFHVVVHLDHVDLDAVAVGPLLHDPGLLGIGPGHPARVDRPADAELGLLRRWRIRRPGAGRHHQRSSDQRNPGRLAEQPDHDSIPFRNAACQSRNSCPLKNITYIDLCNTSPNYRTGRKPVLPVRPDAGHPPHGLRTSHHDTAGFLPIRKGETARGHPIRDSPGRIGWMTFAPAPEGRASSPLRPASHRGNRSFVRCSTYPLHTEQVQNYYA